MRMLETRPYQVSPCWLLVDKSGGDWGRLLSCSMAVSRFVEAASDESSKGESGDEKPGTPQNLTPYGL